MLKLAVDKVTLTFEGLLQNKAANLSTHPSIMYNTGCWKSVIK